MLSPGFIDLMMFMVLVIFTMKGYLTGFIRSVVTIVAVVAAWMGSSMMPDMMSAVIKYSVHLDSPFHHTMARIFTFLLMFMAVNALGFLFTGLLEKIGLGDFDKYVGAFLGFFTGIAIGCLPIFILQSSPTISQMPEIQAYYSSSNFFKGYGPLVRMFSRPASKYRRH